MVTVPPARGDQFGPRESFYSLLPALFRRHYCAFSLFSLAEREVIFKDCQEPGKPGPPHSLAEFNG